MPVSIFHWSGQLIELTLEAVGIGGAIGADGAEGALSQSSMTGLAAETGGLAGTGLEAFGIGGTGVDRILGNSSRTGLYPDPCYKNNSESQAYQFSAMAIMASLQQGQ